MLQERGDVSRALALIDEATPMAETHAGDASPLTLALRVTRAELLHSSGSHDLAAEALDRLQVRDDLPQLLQLRVALTRARLLRDSGNPIAASQYLQRASTMAERLGSQAEPLRVQIEAIAASLP